MSAKHTQSPQKTILQAAITANWGHSYRKCQSMTCGSLAEQHMHAMQVLQCCSVSE